VIKTSRILMAPVGLLAAGALVAGCGGGVPSNSVAKVDDTAITQSQFNHWMGVAASSSQQVPGQKATLPDPPTFQKCIAAARKQLPKPTKGQPKVTDAQLKKQCQQQYDSLRDSVMSFLITQQWVQAEADKRGITVSDAEVDKQYQDLVKRYPKPQDFQSYLKQLGMTEADVKFRLRNELYEKKIRDQALKGTGQVTQAQIVDYYNKNKAQFSKPETRDVRVVLTKSKAQAERALAALRSGQSWKAVAKAYSIDPSLKQNGGLLANQTKGEQEQALDRAVFSAPKGKLSGPVKTQFGWYVFQVEKITPASSQSLKEATPAIRQAVKQQNEKKAFDAFVKDYQKRWTDETRCRQGFVVQYCQGAPKPKPQAGQPGQAGEQ
jgi:foldase protein PrsA